MGGRKSRRCTDCEESSTTTPCTGSTCKDITCDCVIYNGAALTATGITKGDNDCVAKKKIDNKLKEILLMLGDGDFDCELLTP